MTNPIFLERAGHRTWLKWHRGRRELSDPVFTGSRILEAMALGASVEVDLVVTADKGFAVLHDETLDRETTGSGPVAQTSDSQIRTLRLRDNDGVPTHHPVMLLDDLCALMASGKVHPDALLQLDYKEDDTVLDQRALENFARATAPFARNIIVSSGSAKAVEMLTGAVPGMHAGFDPSDDFPQHQALTAGLIETFIEDAVAASPRADLIYLDWRIVIETDKAGLDIIAACHKRQRRVDAWTIWAADAQTRPIVERLLALKVDQITTDDPEGLLAAMSP